MVTEEQPGGHDVNWACCGHESTAKWRRSPCAGVLAALEGVVLFVGNLIATPFIGRRRRQWGTVGTEGTDPLPGDELVPNPKWSYTLGVSVDGVAVFGDLVGEMGEGGELRPPCP